MQNAFIDRLLPAPKNGGFAMDDQWVWCGSVIQGEDGRYHMFASMWTKDVTFPPHWLTNSAVVRASSDTPEGPYTYEEHVLPPRGEGFWDGRMTHNPTIHKSGGTYLLYYTGSTYSGPTPSKDHNLTGNAHTNPVLAEARANQRIGLATAPSVFGPWTRRDQPVLDPRPGKWDGLMTTNAAPCVLDNGAVLLVYKAVGKQKDLLRMGVARADHFEGPYLRLKDDPIFNFDDTGDHVEDAYVWRSGERFELIMKDMKGGICGEAQAGIHAVSPNGVDWTISDPPKAYSRTVRWDDGSVTTQGHLERPQLLIQDGKPTHLFAATANGRGGFGNMDRSWNMVIPLRS